MKKIYLGTLEDLLLAPKRRNSVINQLFLFLEGKFVNHNLYLFFLLYIVYLNEVGNDIAAKAIGN